MDWPLFLVGFLGISALVGVMLIDYQCSKIGYEPLKGRRKDLMPGPGEPSGPPHDERGDETVDPETQIAEVDGQILDTTEIDPQILDEEKGFPGTK